MEDRIMEVSAVFSDLAPHSSQSCIFPPAPFLRVLWWISGKASWISWTFQSCWQAFWVHLDVRWVAWSLPVAVQSLQSVSQDNPCLPTLTTVCKDAYFDGRMTIGICLLFCEANMHSGNIVVTIWTLWDSRDANGCYGFLWLSQVFNSVKALTPAPQRQVALGGEIEDVSQLWNAPHAHRMQVKQQMWDENMADI